MVKPRSQCRECLKVLKCREKCAFSFQSGVLRELVNVTNVRDYYEVFNPVASTDDVVVGREVNSRGGEEGTLQLGGTRHQKTFHECAVKQDRLYIRPF